MQAMQPLIRLRLLASRLTQHELQHLIQSVIESYTAEQILSLIFNHFVLKYQQTKEHDNDVSRIIQMISNVLNARKKTKSTFKPACGVSPKIKIDAIPSDMIGECASFLQVSDYVSFSKCNRRTYIGCNSPVTLQSFSLTHESIGCDLNRFPLLKKLELYSEAFKHYAELNPKQDTLNNVRSLTLHNEIDFKKPESRGLCYETTLLSQCIHIPNISELACSDFGLNHPLFFIDSESFCDLLSSFNQVHSLDLTKVFLTDDFDIQSISNILPNLRSLSVEGVNEPALLLRNKLLEMYSQQMVAIIYDESEMDIGVCCFPKLEVIMSVCPNLDSLFKIVDNAQYLKHFTCGIREFNDKKIKKIIDTLFCKCVHVQEVGMNADHLHIQHIMKWMENALRIKIKKHIRLLFVVQPHANGNREEMNETILSLWKLVDTLESTTDDFMVTLCVSPHSPKAFDLDMDEYKRKYLVCIADDLRSMTVSNKTCKINGYLPEHTF
eukprot:258224_1